MTMRHRLLAILVADAVGYSRLMSADDVGTVAALDVARGVFARYAAQQSGRIVDTAGDSILATFDTAGGAVLAALGIQQHLLAQASTLPAPERMRFRIGLHLGDVIEKEDGTVYGDGVNIAARLQQLGPPEGVTVSQAVHDAVKNRIDATFEDLGAQSLGFSLDDVQALLSLDDGQACSAARRIGDHKLADVRQRLRSLRALEAALAALVARCTTTKRKVACP